MGAGYNAGVTGVAARDAGRPWAQHRSRTPWGEFYATSWAAYREGTPDLIPARRRMPDRGVSNRVLLIIWT